MARDILVRERLYYSQVHAGRIDRHLGRLLIGVHRCSNALRCHLSKSQTNLVEEPLDGKRFHKRDIRRDRVFSAHSLGRLGIDADPATGMLLTAIGKGLGKTCTSDDWKRFIETTQED